MPENIDLSQLSLNKKERISEEIFSSIFKSRMRSVSQFTKGPNEKENYAIDFLNWLSGILCIKHSPASVVYNYITEIENQRTGVFNVLIKEYIDHSDFKDPQDVAFCILNYSKPNENERYDKRSWNSFRSGYSRTMAVVQSMFETVPLYVEVSDKVNWSAGDFGDRGSCFWGGYSRAIEVLLAHDFLALKFYNGQRGIARSWVRFTHRAVGEIRDHNPKMMSINHYGLSTSDYKDAICKITGWKGGSIDGIAKFTGKFRSHVYINGSPMMFYDTNAPRVPRPNSINVKFKRDIKLGGYSCDICGATVGRMPRYVDGLGYCNGCTTELLVTDKITGNPIDVTSDNSVCITGFGWIDRRRITPLNIRNLMPVAKSFLDAVLSSHNVLKEYELKVIQRELEG